MPILWTPAPRSVTQPGGQLGFARGALPSPKHALLRAPAHIVTAAPPAQVAYVPKQLSYWGNDRYGICVTAEEAFAKGCDCPNNPAGVFITEANCIAWARSHGVLNGANLSSVMDDMIQKGFSVPPQLYNDGRYSGVDFSNETILRSAIAQGPVKIAIAADALPSGAGSQQGWWDLGTRDYRGTDHCVALNGYGAADWLFKQLEVPLPSGLRGDLQGYLLFTWSTIGFVDHRWIMGTTDEAWVRNPTTVGVPPLPIPTPPGPVPTPTPTPGPAPSIIEIEVKQAIQPGRYLLFPNTPV